VGRDVSRDCFICFIYFILLLYYLVGDYLSSDSNAYSFFFCDMIVRWSSSAVCLTVRLKVGVGIAMTGYFLLSYRHQPSAIDIDGSRGGST
jgi:hypothetical protein